MNQSFYIISHLHRQFVMHLWTWTKKNKNNRNSKVSKFKMFLVFFVHSIEKSIIINGKFHVFRCCDEINKYQKLNWKKKNFSAQLSSHTKWKEHRMSCFFTAHIKAPKIASIVTIPSETSLNVNGCLTASPTSKAP